MKSHFEHYTPDFKKSGHAIGKLQYGGYLSNSPLFNLQSVTTTMYEHIQSELEMIGLFEMTPDLVCIAGEDGYFKKVNKAVFDTLEYTPEEIYSSLISSFIHPDDREITGRSRAALLQGRPLLNFQNRYITKSGKTVWLEWTSVYLPQKKVVFAIAKNISDNKKREKEFADKYNAYENLAHHFKNRAEEERRYVAFELHEKVAQLAASLKLQVDLFQQNTLSMPAAASSQISEIMSTADSLVKAIRRIAFSISSSMLDDLGFNETMIWISREFATLNGVACNFHSDCADHQWRRDQQTDVFRISQLALRSLAEQEDYAYVSISLKDTPAFYSFQIVTDGNISDDGDSLLNIRQLAATMNAELAVNTAGEKETIISLLIKKSGEVPKG